MKASISGILACSSGTALAYLTVRLGHSFVYTQIVDPYLGGWLQPVSVAGTVLLTFAAAIVALAIILEFLEGYEPPRLFGRTTYTLVGGAGLLGSAVGSIQTVHEIYTYAGMEPDLESIAALLLVAIPTLYTSYRLWRTPIEPIHFRAGENYEALNPEYVRKATVRRSGGNERTHPRVPSKKEEAKREPQESRPQQSESPRSNQQIDYAELEFTWTTDTDVSFEDVGGMSELKSELERDIIKPLTTHREAAEKLGISAPNVIFYGPPGTGKTYVARALATELGLPFAQLSGADLQSKWINESASKVKTLFDEAATVAEEEGGAVVFLDELDSVLKNRVGAGNAHEEDNKVVNEFLNHLEDTGDHDIVFIGATNRLESLDSAGIRSGRIDKKIHIGKPDRKARKSILEAQLSDLPHTLTREQLDKIAEQTEGLTAADLNRLIENAARMSLFERDDDKITIEDIRRVLVG